MGVYLDGENLGIVVVDKGKQKEIIEGTVETLTLADLDGVEKIGQYKFYKNTKLTKLEIPTNVKNINDYAFGYSKLSEIIFEENSQLKAIGNHSFEYTNLKTVELPNSVKNIGSYAFYDSSSYPVLKYLGIPDEIEYIGDSVVSSYYKGFNSYGECSYLGNENNPYVALIKANSSITDLIINKDCKVIADSPTNFGSLQTVAFEDGSSLKHIGRQSFYYKTKLEKVDLPSTIISIGYQAFTNCTALTELNLDLPLLTSIPEMMCSNCSSLKSITIGENVQNIGRSAFSECKGLIEINYNAKEMQDFNNSQFVFANAGQSGDGIVVNIGENVERIPKYLFYPYGLPSQFPNVKLYVIGSNVKSIGTGSLMIWENGNGEIKILATTPPILESNGIDYKITTIYIPTGTLDAYRTATNWSSFASKFVEIDMEE